MKLYSCFLLNNLLRMILCKVNGLLLDLSVCACVFVFNRFIFGHKCDPLYCG